MPLIENWDENLFINNKIFIDKDLKCKDNKVYSLKTCIFLSSYENNIIKYRNNKIKYKICGENEIHTWNGCINDFIKHFKLPKYPVLDYSCGKRKNNKIKNIEIIEIIK